MNRLLQDIENSTQQIEMTCSPRVDPDSFARACAIRGVSGADLRRIGGFSKATLANLRAGRPVRPGTLQRLSATLGRFPVLSDLPDVLIGPARVDRAERASGSHR